MIIPVRCFTCGKVIGDKWDYFNERKTEKEKQMKEAREKEKKQQNANANSNAKEDTIEDLAFNESWGYSEILDELGLNRICCRRHMLGHVNLIDII